MELKEDMILLDQYFSSKDEAIRQAGQLLVDGGIVDEDYIDSMLERETIVTTHMGNFIAIPHGTDEGKEAVKKTGISIVQVPFGVDFAPDQSEEKLAMVIFGIAGVGNEHLDLLSKIAIFASDLKNVVRLADATSKQEIIDMLMEVEN